METVTTESFQKSYRRLPPHMKKIVDTKIRRLLDNHTHPSLQAHRLRRANADNVWICYITVTDRLLYQFKNDFIYLWDVGSHSVVDRVHLRSFDCSK